MADYGLLGGIGEGIKSGMQGYFDVTDRLEKKKQAALEQAMKEKQLQLSQQQYDDQMMVAGFKKKPTGEIGPLNPAKDTTDQQLQQSLQPNVVPQAKTPEERWEVESATPEEVASLRNIYTPIVGKERATGLIPENIPKTRAAKLMEGLLSKPESLNKDLSREKTQAEINKLNKETELLGVDKKAEKLMNENITKLREERSGLPTTKTSQTISVAYAKMLKAAEKPSPANDMSLIFGIMKMYDPNSTVREGEYATAQNATNVPQQVLNMYNSAIKGTKLSDEQRADFMDSAAKMYSAQEQAQKQVDDFYSAQAKRMGMNPADVIVPFGLVGGQTKKEETKTIAQKQPTLKSQVTDQIKGLLGANESAAAPAASHPEAAAAKKFVDENINSNDPIMKAKALEIKKRLEQ